MPKTFTSPSKRFPGTVVLPDWYDWGRIMEYDAALDRAKAAGENRLLEMQAQSEAIIPMVDEWHIEGLPEKPDKLPGSPINAAVLLHRWLFQCVGEVMGEGDDTLPFSGPGSGPG